MLQHVKKEWQFKFQLHVIYKSTYLPCLGTDDFFWESYKYTSTDSLKNLKKKENKHIKSDNSDFDYMLCSSYLASLRCSWPWQIELCIFIKTIDLKQIELWRHFLPHFFFWFFFNSLAKIVYFLHIGRLYTYKKQPI